MSREPDEITNSQDIIDSRDVIERIDFLEDEIEDLKSSAEEAVPEEPDPETGKFKATDGSLHDDRESAIEESIADSDRENYREELRKLEELAEQGSGYADDWRHGSILIRDSHFEDYARQYAEDIGAIDRNARWPNDCIDWEKAARELQMDYTSVEFDGVTYWVR